MSSAEKQSRLVRIWTSVNVEEVKKHLITIDDHYGTCGNCQQLGLNYLEHGQCPGCNTTFKYLASTLKNPADIAKIVNRIQKEGLPLQVIEKDDFERADARDALGDLFKT